MSLTTATTDALMKIFIAVMSTLLGAIALDTYSRLKARSKKVLEKKKAEEDERFKKLIEPLQAELSKVSGDLKNISEGVRDSLRNQLHTLYKHCLKVGFRTSEDTQNFEHMFESYTKLGGNGYMVTVHTSFLALPERIVTLGLTEK